MEGDIDIKEHDILDNPQVTTLFPNLSEVKTETMEFDVPISGHKPHLEIKQEVSNEEHQVCKTEIQDITNTNVSELFQTIVPNHLNMLQRANIVRISYNSIAKMHQNIPIENTVQVNKKTRSIGKALGENSSKSLFRTIVKKSVAIKPVVEENEASDSVDLQHNPPDSSKIRNSGIVCGTNNYKRPEVTSLNAKVFLNDIIPVPTALSVKTKEYLPAAVVLKDCITILKLSSRYCESCKILFPTKHSFNAHNWSTHSVPHKSTSNPVDTEPDDIPKVRQASESVQSFACLQNWNKRNIVHNGDKKLNFVVTYFEPNKISYSKTKKHFKAKLPLDTSEHNTDIKNKFYKVYPCLDCNIYYLDSKARKTHIVKVNHKILLKPKHCRFCKLRFANELFKKHINECPLRANSGYIKVMEYKRKATTKINEWDDILLESPEKRATRTLKNEFRIVNIEESDIEDLNETRIIDNCDDDDIKCNVKSELH